MLSFTQGERVLCFHGPLMYEAKVIKAEDWNPSSNSSGEIGPHYFVHYKGWKQTWDEWVPEERLKKYNEENIKQQRVLINAQMAKDAAERAALAKAQLELDAFNKKNTAILNDRSTANRDSNAPRESNAREGGRREDKMRNAKRAREGEAEDDFMKRPEIKISIPEVLKVQLVDDWEAITKNQQLVPIPRTPSVDQILNLYRDYVAESYPERIRLTEEVVAGLRLYFNKCLGNNLLYRFERGQYSDHYKTLKEDQEVSSIYGAEHLLRLFVNLPEMIAHTAMDPETIAVLKENITDFLRWMGANRAELFCESYQNTASPYQNLNRA